MTRNEELGQRAEELGHTRPVVFPTASGRRFYGECSCGYRSTTRTSLRLAADALIYHMHKVIREADSVGPLNGKQRDTPSSRKVPPLTESVA